MRLPRPEDLPAGDEPGSGDAATATMGTAAPGASAPLPCHWAAHTVDAANANVIRSHAHHCALFKRAGLRLRRFRLQANFPAELYAVRMYLLVPE